MLPQKLVRAFTHIVNNERISLTASLQPDKIEQLRNSQLRVQDNNWDTIMTLAHRTYGAAYQFVPPMSITLGMKEILSAKKIRVYRGGAGDAFLSGTIAGLALGLPFQKGTDDRTFGVTPITSAMELGTLVASLSVTLYRNSPKAKDILHFQEESLPTRSYGNVNLKAWRKQRKLCVSWKPIQGMRNSIGNRLLTFWTLIWKFTSPFRKARSAICGIRYSPDL